MHAERTLMRLLRRCESLRRHQDQPECFHNFKRGLERLGGTWDETQPFSVEIRRAHEYLYTQLQNSVSKRKRQRIQGWQKRMKESADNNFSELCKWVGEKSFSGFTFVRNAQGVFTAIPAQVDEAIRRAWSKHFRRDDFREKPTDAKEKFLERYAEHQTT